MNSYKKHYLLYVLTLTILQSHHLFCMMEVLPEPGAILGWGRTIQESLERARGPAAPGTTLVDQQTRLKGLYFDKLSLQPEIEELGAKLAPLQASLQALPREDEARAQADVRAAYQQLQGILQPTLARVPGSYHDIQTNVAELIRQLQEFAVPRPPENPRRVAIQQQLDALQGQQAEKARRRDEIQHNSRLYQEEKARAIAALRASLEERNLERAEFRDTLTTLQDTLARTKTSLARQEPIKNATEKLIQLKTQARGSYTAFRTNMLDALLYPKLPEGAALPEHREERPPENQREAQVRLTDAMNLVNRTLTLITCRLPDGSSMLGRWDIRIRILCDALGHAPQEADLTPERLAVLQAAYDQAQARETQLQGLYDATQTRLASFGHQVLERFNPNHPATLAQTLIASLLVDDGMTQEDAEVLLTLTPADIEARIVARRDAIVQNINEFLASPDMKVRLTVGWRDEEYDYLDLLKKIASIKDDDKRRALEILTAILNKIHIRTAERVEIDLHNPDIDQRHLSIVSRFFVMSLCLSLKDRFEKTIKPSLDQFIDETRT